MSSRIGRDRFRRDHHPSSSSSPGPSPLPMRKNPPSRHLWLGNLAHHLTKAVLSDHLARFGELESVAFPPGRSYAFVNFFNENDAIAAMDSLQGCSLAGMPLRIEFAKADKSSAPPRDENYLQHRDELQPLNRGSALSKRESRMRHASPDALYQDSSRRIENSDDHPSEILWIGFPSFLKVDENLLRKAFSPFGEIEKITAFQGRTYAFVQFRNLASACRAKETLQGKLFGNPRVHICFARSDTASSTGGGRRDLGPNAHSPPHFKHNGWADTSEQFFHDPSNISRAHSIRPAKFSDMEYRDREIRSLSRKESSWTCEERSPEFEPDVGARRGLQGYHGSPIRDGTQFHEISPRRFPTKSAFLEGPWDPPSDANFYHGVKKLKTDFFLQEELPEYSLHISEHDKYVSPRMLPDYPLSDETGPLPCKQPPDHPINFNRPTVLEDRHEWRSSHDTFQSPPPLPATSLDWKRTTTELHQPAPKEEWKWEGTLAKGGTPVCRARCFPVGRIMDLFLPEFLDCTARTGLDMLAKHYYQAAGSWVVFFVPASDTDMGYYNEFLHYLGEKQRAAVSKLDERHTLFLVPPSDFSEKVLKVPGKLSISGVVLKLEPASPSVPPLPRANEAKATSLMYPYADPYQKSESPSGQFHSVTSYLRMGKPGNGGHSFQVGLSTSVPSFLPACANTNQSVSDQMENRHDFQPTHHTSALGPTWSSQLLQATTLSSRDSTLQGSSVAPEHNLGNYKSGHSSLSYPGSSKSSISEQKLPAAEPLNPGGLSSSVLGGKGISVSPSSLSATEEFRLSSMMGNHPENQSKLPFQVAGNLSTLQFHQPQEPPLAEVMLGASHGSVAGNRGTQDIQSMGSAHDGGEADPQKRLQATLQLAAALLQQIQQGKET